MKGCFGIVYKVTNRINEKIYVGQTVTSLKQRRCVHECEARNKSECCFHRAIRKYGEKTFEWAVVERCNSKEDLDLAEEWYIRYYRTFVRFSNCNGYNLSLGGEGSVGFRHTKEARQKISNLKKNRPLSEEHRQKISMSLKKDNSPNFGKSLSEKTKKKISKSKKGKPLSRETCQKMSESRKGNVLLKKTRQKIGEANSCDWLIVFPNSREEIVRNMSKFCKENGLFLSNMSRVASGYQKHHKHFKCKKLDKRLNK